MQCTYFGVFWYVIWNSSSCFLLEHFLVIATYPHKFVAYPCRLLAAMKPTSSRRSNKLVDYTKQRGSHHLCAENKVLTTMTKAFLSHEHRSDYNGIPSMETISERSVDTTDTDDDCTYENAEPNDFLPKAPPRTNRRSATTGLRERFHQSARSLLLIHERQSIVFKRGDSGPEISTRSLATSCSDPASVEPIDFFLKIPPRTQRRRSDLLEIFQSSRSQSRKKVSIFQ